MAKSKTALTQTWPHCRLGLLRWGDDIGSLSIAPGLSSNQSRLVRRNGGSSFDGLAIALNELAVILVLFRIGPKDGRMVTFRVGTRIVHSSVGIAVDRDIWEGWVGVGEKYGFAFVVGFHMPGALLVLV